MGENPYQSPKTSAARHVEQRSVVRLTLSGVSFLGAIFLAVIAYKAVAISVSIGPNSVTPKGYQSATLAAIPWACVNVLSFGLVAVGLFRRRQRLTVVGGCVLVVSTVILMAVQALIR